MKYQDYLDKVHGGWLGKCLGGAAGVAVEGLKKLIAYPHYKETIRTDLPNDDLDLQLLWLEVLQKKGIYISSQDLADAWDRQCWYPFSEYGLFLKNYERGIMPAYSGWFNNPLFKEGVGCPIRSEIWGMVWAGYPDKAAEYAYMDGTLDHADASVWIEQYYAAIEAAAFYESDIKSLILKYLDYLPQGSAPRDCVELVWKHYQEDATDWQKARTKLLRKYAHNEFTNSTQNLGLVILALLYGENDLDKTVNIAFRCGYDADCTCATAGAILGIVLGASKIPDSLKQIAGENFVAGITLDRTDFSILGLSKETCQIGLGADALMQGKISDIPPEIEIPQFIAPDKTVEIEVEYQELPSISPEKPCRLKLVFTNHTQTSLTDTPQIKGLKAGWQVSGLPQQISLEPGQTVEIEAEVRLTYVDILDDKNIMSLCFGDWSKSFGISGTSRWKVIGPYLEQLLKADCFTEGEPDPDSPTLECMVNNAVYLEKEYIDETNFAKVFAEEDCENLYAAEDMLPMDEFFSFHGQACFYLRQVLISPEDREIWVVVGNNDGFALWVNGQEVVRKDEIRLWTPYNNYFSVKLKKGENELVLKLLRRTESLKFSMGLRKHEGDHFHRKRWFTDFSYRI